MIECLAGNYFKVFGRASFHTLIEHVLYGAITRWFVYASGLGVRDLALMPSNITARPIAIKTNGHHSFIPITPARPMINRTVPPTR